MRRNVLPGGILAVLTVLMALAALPALTACENDAYDSGTGPLSLTRADFVEVYTGGDCAVDHVLTDDGCRLALSKRVTRTWLDKPDTLYRAVLYYNVAAETAAGSMGSAGVAGSVGGMTAVEPVALSMVPVLYPQAADSFRDGVRTDPVKFESMWVGGNGRYVNIGFYLKNGRMGEESLTHTVGMVYRRTVTNADGTRTVHLELYHDQGGVPEYYSSRYYVSVPCGEIDGDSVSIAMNTYDKGMFEKTIRIVDVSKCKGSTK